MASKKEITNLKKFFQLQRIDGPEGSYLECKYKEGTQELNTSKIQKERRLGTAAMLVGLNIIDTEKLYSISMKGYKGYIIRPKGNTLILPYGEMNIGVQITVKEPSPILKKIKKERAELHITDIPLEIPLEAVV